ncbi:MAG: hypothetical protein AAFP07_12440, partial [Cyanobacteria bacterium J06606_4]
LEKMWYPYFGRSLRNEHGLPERTFPYVLRHTQMRPRQLIVLCNAIARRATEKGSFPRFHPQSIVAAVHNRQVSLAEEVINSYSSVYPRVGRILEALSGLPMVFRGNLLDKRAPLTASEWIQSDYSPHSFRQLTAELGIIGRVRHINPQAGYAEADFEYSTESRLPLLTDNTCAIHPMFYRKLSVRYDQKIRVYPFPDHEDFKPWSMKSQA